MSDSRPLLTVEKISWRDILPWILLFKTFAIARRGSVVFLAAVGILLTTFSWEVIDYFYSPPEKVATKEEQKQKYSTEIMNQQNLIEQNQNLSNEYKDQKSIVDARVTEPIFSPSGVKDIFLAPLKIQELIPQLYWRLAGPTQRFFSGELTWSEWWASLFKLSYLIFIWGFIGGAITRIAVVQLGQEEIVSTKEALMFANAHKKNYWGGPTFTLLAAVVVVLPMVFLGFFMRLDIGVLVAGFGWVFVLVGGLLITHLFVGTFFGWPLMFASVSADRADSFDAVSRSFSYVYQRPFQYVFYVLLAFVYGVICMSLVWGFASLILYFSRIGISWGMGEVEMAQFMGLLNGQEVSDPLPSFVTVGGSVAWAWESFLYLVVHAISYGLFFSLVSAIYLLLRKSVDKTEFDEIESVSTVPVANLSEIELDETGAPRIKVKEPVKEVKEVVDKVPEEEPPSQEKKADEKEEK
ncbi:MAG: hypothetical protein MPJ24_08075 [Pirellulaceae bacterium]|nr:hypothetical protein [Pirellulaceae bacterium]